VKIPRVVFESLPRGEYYLFPSLPPRKVSSLSQGDALHFPKAVFSIPQKEYDHSSREILFTLP
jgi:hypothetical protein